MKYNVQCLNGHMYVAPKGSDLERRCKERADKGYIDALILDSSQCEDCQAERDERMLASADAPLDDDDALDECLHS